MGRAISHVGGETVSVGLLGTFRISSNGTAPAVPFTAQRLVAYLALNRRPVDRISLAEHLWSEGTIDRARSSLRAALWRIQHCGLDVVTSCGGMLELAEGVEVDVSMQVESAHRVLNPSAELTADDRQRLEGELLPDWYDDWVTFERERLRQLRLHALEVFAQKLCLEERFGEAVEAALACLRADPFRESSHRVLVRIHLAEGNVVEALRQYETYRSLIAHKLGLRPSSEFDDVVRELITPTVRRRMLNAERTHARREPHRE